MDHNRIEVLLGERSYPVLIGHGMLSTLAPALQQHNIANRVVLITDTTVASFYLRPIEEHLRHFGYETMSIIVPPGERQKRLARAEKIFGEMLAEGIDRKAAIIALGGGVIGDLAGFVAATYHRGISLVQIPTTLLSQVDSSVGGKVAVNHALGKNMIGTFYQPVLVWVDADFLDTLPSREITCGLGEIVKYGVIADPELFSFLETNLDRFLTLQRDALSYVQSRCVEIKAHIVSQDEKESGLRVVLNFGHTVAHALEAAGRYQQLKHGEAVLLGMIAESYISRKKGLITEADHVRIVNLINRIPNKVMMHKLKNADILKAMKRDKKSVYRRNRFILPLKIGEVQAVEGVESTLILESLKYLRSAEQRHER